MDSLTINFTATYSNMLDAHLAFHRASKIGVFWRTYRVPLFSVIIFFVMYLSAADSVRNDLFWNKSETGVLLPTNCLSASIVFSIIFGWAANVILKIRNENNIAQQIRIFYLPSYFGKTVITFSQEGVTYQSPLIDINYSWRFFDFIIITKDYLFICRGKGIFQNLDIWIPRDTFNQETEGIFLSIEKWISESRQT